MKERFSKFVLSIFIVAIFSMAIQAMVSPVSLEELTTNSDFIFVGKVISVKEIGEEEIAKVEVLKMLKGNSQNSVFISVTRTWACDVSDAAVGETALFFLGKYQIRPTWERNLEKTCELKKQIDSAIGKDDFYYISHSGYGRMPIEKKNGFDYVSILYGQVFAPKNIKVTKKDIREYTSVDLAKLNDITKEVLKHSNKEPIHNWDDLGETDESFKQILAYRKMSDEEFGEVCEEKPVTPLPENCEPEELSIFEKIWNFIFG